MNDAPLTFESRAVQVHLEFLLGVIKRTAENSRSCKVWCITIVSAVLVLVARTEDSTYSLLGLVPTVLFLILDAYYLALEQGFRNSYDRFVERLHSGQLHPSSLFVVAQCGPFRERYLDSLRSFSVRPFYLSVVATVILAFLFIY